MLFVELVSQWPATSHPPMPQFGLVLPFEQAKLKFSTPLCCGTKDEGGKMRENFLDCDPTRDKGRDVQTMKYRFERNLVLEASKFEFGYKVPFFGGFFFWYDATGSRS